MLHASQIYPDKDGLPQYRRLEIVLKSAFNANETYCALQKSNVRITMLKWQLRWSFDNSMGNLQCTFDQYTERIFHHILACNRRNKHLPPSYKQVAFPHSTDSFCWQLHGTLFLSLTMFNRTVILYSDSHEIFYYGMSEEDQCISVIFPLFEHVTWYALSRISSILLSVLNVHRPSFL